MEISNIKYNKLPLDGTNGGKSIKIKTLEWMQAHPERCKRTNIKTLSIQVANAVGSTWGSVAQTLHRLLNEGVIARTNGKRFADFRINYFHPAIPKELLDTASEEDKKFIAEVHERAEKMNGTVDSEGAIETKTVVATEPPVITRDRMIREEIEQTPPVEVKQTKRGTQITFTININL